jgi:hypothetical protein
MVGLLQYGLVCIVESAVVDEIKQDGDLPGLLHSLYRWLDYESLATAFMSRRLCYDSPFTSNNGWAIM